MSNIDTILNGYLLGDKNGGPTKLAKIRYKSLSTSNAFKKSDLVNRYLH